MFTREAEMTEAVSRWLESTDLVVKPEFVTPWGICDLVGVGFNSTHVSNRLKLRQFKPINSITRAMLLLQIPDVDTLKSTTVSHLLHSFKSSIPEEIVRQEMKQLVVDRFVIQKARGRLQKVNGWLPLQDQLVAVELKLTRIEEAMHQAFCNLGFAENSYVAFPSDVAERVALNSSRWRYYFESGIGLLSVTNQKCRILITARKTRTWIDEAIELYCVEKFWRTRTYRQLSINGSATASGRLSVPGTGRSGSDFPNA